MCFPNYVCHIFTKFTKSWTRDAVLLISFEVTGMQTQWHVLTDYKKKIMIWYSDPSDAIDTFEFCLLYKALQLSAGKELWECVTKFEKDKLTSHWHPEPITD
jgi:hypothetical protein